jgi:hypothetical protein
MEDGVPAGLDQTIPFTFEQNAHTTARDLEMELWLDGPVVFQDGRVVSSGNVIVTRDPRNYESVIGGKWLTGFSTQAWPDYMWVPHSMIPMHDPDETVDGRKPDDPYRNPFIDPEWIQQYLMTQTPDPNSHPVPPESAPVPSPTPSPHLE